MSAVVLLIFILIITIFLRKGVVWLILGSTASVPPLVSPGSSDSKFSPFVYIPFTS